MNNLEYLISSLQLNGFSKEGKAQLRQAQEQRKMYADFVKLERFYVWYVLLV